MPYTKEYIQAKLEKELKTDYIQVVDESDGCGAKFSAVIVSRDFENKQLLQRQRLVNGILSEELKEIHSFRQRTLTPEQWKKENA